MEVRVHLHSERRQKNVAILVSKEPHCLETLLDDFRAKKLRGQIVGVFANHPDLEPIAKKEGLKFAYHPTDSVEKHFAWLSQQLKDHAVDLVVLARYMRILPPSIVQQYRHKIINFHP